MICACHECRRCYWKYRTPWETPGFCSWFCREIWRDTPGSHRESDPGMPVAILELIRSHNRIVHHAAAPLDWVDCAECERLAYHSPAPVAPVSIAAEASRRDKQHQSSERKKGNFHVA
jgi:hypothetical protein